MVDALISLYIGGLAATLIVSSINWSGEASATRFVLAHLLWPIALALTVWLVIRDRGD